MTIAPSGRILSARAIGTIAFNSKVSGVPDLLLTLTTPAGPQGVSRKMELPVFHPCVRLARWRERPGELSFIPPDGRFILAGYETDLLPIDPYLDTSPTHIEKLFLPAFVDVRKSLGSTGSEFEVRLTLNTNFPGVPATSRPSGSGSGTSTPSFLGGGLGSSGSSTTPVLDEVVVTVPISKAVRNITDMRASRGDTIYSPGDEFLEWRVPTRDAGSVSGTATLRCTVVGHQDDGAEELESEMAAGAALLQGYYDTESSYQQDPTTYSSSSYPPDSSKPSKPKKSKKTKSTKGKKSKSKKASSAEEPTSTATPEETPSPTTHTPPPPQPSSTGPSASGTVKDSASRKAKLKSALMPTSATVSFSVRGWLPSGIRVESLNIDPRRSRGLGEGVRPYKGVKYLCVSRRGVERRC